MKDSILIALLVSLVATATAFWMERQSPVVPDNAPEVVYSGERAMTLLRHFLRENVPHPVGSDQNRLVKRRIQAWLTEQGFDHEEQQAVGCRKKWRNCAYVENIIATIPGEVEGPYVALMAHYDSVPHAPGAGDDMSGVVAILETARAVRAVGGIQHPLMLIITDGEETGLHGAEAFFNKHPLAKEVGVVLNLEGSGTRGASMVLRTSQDNGWYMRLFAERASQKFGSSLANEVFNHMPNDTDFSVVREAGIPGIDFAFAGERNHYHTPNDNTENLDPRTVQHHGDNLFPLAMQLANIDLSSPEAGSVVYLNAYGAWLQWPASWTLMLFGVIGLLLATAAVRLGGGAGSVLVAATVVPLGVLIAGGVAVHLVMLLLATIHGDSVPWPAYEWPLRLLVLTSLLFPAFVAARWLTPRFTRDTLLVGGWTFLWLIFLPIAVFIPDAAAMMVPVLLLAAAVLALAGWLPRLRAPLLYCTLVSAGFFIPTALLLEETQGYRLVVAVWPWVGFYVVTLLAFLGSGLQRKITTVVLGLFFLSLLAALVLPVYSAHRPQHINIVYIENADTQAGLLQMKTSGVPPQTMLNIAEFASTDKPVLPWYSGTLDYTTAVEAERLTAPELTVNKVETIPEGRRVTVQLSSNRNAMRLRLFLPTSANPRSALLDGTLVPLSDDKGDSEDEYIGLVLYGMQGREATITLELGSEEPISAYLVDTTFTLPAVAQALASARPSNASPVHSGDRSTVFKRFQF